MALDNKRSVYEIAIEIGGKLKQSLGTATSGASRKLSGLAVYADKTARATTSLSKAINGMLLLKGTSWVSGHMISIGKSAIAAASEMETYRTTLNTVLRDEEKAADMMRWSTEFAAHTPYNTGDIVDAVTRLEAYGFKSQAMLENIGNMASAMNKDLPTAVEAVYKATLGEMELMENNFAITKKLINEKAQEWYGQAVIDASKKITDTEMYTNTLLRLIEEKFEGGMEAQSRTWAGIKSNMEDSRDAIFRRIVGMDAAGEATEDGLYARMLRMGQRAADEIGEFADSEVLDEWAAKIGEGVDSAGKEVERLKEITKEWWGENKENVSETLGNIGTNLEDTGAGLIQAGEKLYSALLDLTPLILKITEFGTGIVSGFVGEGSFLDKLLTGFEKAAESVGKLVNIEVPSWQEAWDNMQEVHNATPATLAGMPVLPVVSRENMVQPFAGLRTGMPTLQTFSSGAITVNVTSAPGDNAYTIGETVANQVKSAVQELAHQNARVSLRPNKMQTAY